MVYWSGFLKKADVKTAHVSLVNVIEVLRGFLMPPARAVAEGKEFDLVWRAGGPWCAED